MSQLERPGREGLSLKYEDFSLTFLRHGEAGYCVQARSSPAGEISEVFTSPWSPGEIPAEVRSTGPFAEAVTLKSPA